MYRFLRNVLFGNFHHAAFVHTCIFLCGFLNSLRLEIGEPISWGPSRTKITKEPSTQWRPCIFPIVQTSPLAPLCKLHEVLHMFSMALTACPERGRHTNKLTEKSLERILGRLFNKPQVPLSMLCPVLYNLFHLSFTFFCLSPSIFICPCRPPQSVHTEGQSWRKGGFSWRKATKRRQRCNPLQVGKESGGFGQVVWTVPIRVSCRHLRWGVANGAGSVKTLRPLWAKSQGVKEHTSCSPTRSQSLQ